MATRVGTARTEHIGTALLEQLAALDAEGMSPETARRLLRLHFDSSHQRRLAALSEKAQEGTLSSSEEGELDEYIRVADLLAILQSRARRALKPAGPPS
jgi:hypothetical protein